MRNKHTTEVVPAHVSLQLSLFIILLGVEQTFILLTRFSHFSWALLGQ